MNRSSGKCKTPKMGAISIPTVRSLFTPIFVAGSCFESIESPGSGSGNGIVRRKAGTSYQTGGYALTTQATPIYSVYG